MLTVEQRDAYRSSLDAPSSAVSADGRFVAFTSYSRLAPADTNNSSDLYVLDRARRHVTLESADIGGLTGDSSHPDISGDGRFVVFERAGVVLLHDRNDGVTTIVGAGTQPAITEQRPGRGLHRLWLRSRGRDRRERREERHLFAESARWRHSPESQRRPRRARRVACGERHSPYEQRCPLCGVRIEAAGARNRGRHNKGFRARHRAPGHTPCRAGLGTVDQRRRPLRRVHRARESTGAHISRGPADGRDSRHHQQRAPRSRKWQERKARNIAGRPIRRISIGGERSRRGGRFQFAVGRLRLRPHDQCRQASQWRSAKKPGWRRAPRRRSTRQGRSSPSRRAIRPMRPTSGTTSICTSLPLNRPDRLLQKGRRSKDRKTRL